VASIRKAAKLDRPFFLYLPFNAPHYPMHAPQKYLDRFADLPWDRQVMAAMLSAMDDGVGAVVDELERLNILDNTCIFFQSDNGPSRETRNWLDGRRDPYYGGTTAMLKGHKSSLFEGGIRVPAIMSWPGIIPSGQVSHIVGSALDIFPTFLKAAGGDPNQYQLDGMDLTPILNEKMKVPEREMYWQLGKQTAMRKGNWKLVLDGRLVEGLSPEDEVHLADLSTDMGERINLKALYPEVVGAMTEQIRQWQQHVVKQE
jgi:arylsulfatase A-like enzyme